MRHVGTSASGSATALKASDQLQLYRRIFAESVDGIAIIDRDGYYVEQNHAHELLTGYSDGDLAGQTPAIHLGQEAFDVISAALAERGRFRGELPSRTKDGRIRILDLTAFSVLNEAGEIICFVGMKRDISERRHAEDERHARIRELEAVYALTIALNHATRVEDIYDTAIDAVLSALECDRASILIFDDLGVMRFKAWRRLSDSYRSGVEGYSPWSPETLNPKPLGVPDVMLAPDLEPYRQTMLAEGIHGLAFIPIVCESSLLGQFVLYFDQPHQFSDREMHVAQALGAAVAVAIIRHSAQEALRRSEQIAAAGRLAASIAHEINNPLAAITNLVYLLRGRVTDPASAGYLQNLDSELTRVSQISRQTLGFYRDTSSPAAVELCSVLHDTIAVYRPRLEAKHLQLTLNCEKVQVSARSGELRQIFSNILVNAIDACEDRASIRVTAALRDQFVDVVISDTGHGIEPEHLQRIFDPFFTTRKTGGTGLGLWITRQLIEKNGGNIRVSTSTLDDHGTSVHVTFPAINAQDRSRLAVS